MKNLIIFCALYSTSICAQVNTTEPKKIKTNYNVKKIPKLAYWNENNTLLFSKKERQILNDIKNVFK